VTASSGIGPDGTWTPAFPAQRPPAEPGNQLATTHGARAFVKLAPRAAQLADDIRAVAPAGDDSDEVAIRLLALTLAQVEAATSWLAEQGIVDGEGNPRGILRHLGTMMNTAARLANALGMTPTARAKMGLNLARARGEALRQHLDEHYGDGAKDRSRDAS
jgi:hypothetical protein